MPWWKQNALVNRSKPSLERREMAGEIVNVEIPEELVRQFNEAQEALALADQADIKVSEAEFELSEAQSNLDVAREKQLEVHQEANAQAQDVLEDILRLLRLK
jgi:hypothetical protein